MNGRTESGMEAAERRALVSRVDALERRVAALEAERTQVAAPRPAASAEAPASTDEPALRRRAEARMPRREGASLRHLGVTRRSDGTGLANLARTSVLIALGFLIALGVGWVVIIAQPGAGGGWSETFGGPDAVAPAEGD